MTRIHADIPDRSGAIIDDRYEIVRTIGGGETGAVYEARQIRLDRPVAVKMLRRECASRTGVAARFLGHAQAVSRIRHPNVVDIVDFGDHEGIPYYVMEYLEGLDLEELVETSGPLPWTRVRGILKQTALALEAAHLQGVAHNNLKASNCFLVTPSDPDQDAHDVKLIGFGAPADLAEVCLPPPEVAPPTPVEVAADVHALGVIAYKALTGVAPFDGDASPDTVPVPLRHHDASIPVDVEIWVLRALARDPERRFGSITEARVALRDIDASLAGASSTTMTWSSLGSGQLDVTTTSHAQLRPRGRPRARWAAVLGVMALATAGSLMLGGAIERPVPSAQVERITTHLTREDPPIRHRLSMRPFTFAPVALPPPELEDAPLEEVVAPADLPPPPRRVRRPTPPADAEEQEGTCIVPFTLDERGHKYFKRECLE